MAASALPNAAWDGDLQKVRLLLNQGVDVDATDNGDTALMIASNLGHLKIVQLLLKKNAKLDIKNKRGDTALTCASAEGHLEVVKALLNKNAKVDIQNEMGCTAVQLSSERGHVELLKILLEKGAKMDSQNVDGDTALILACCRGRKDCIRALLEHGADTRIRNKIGKIARDKMMEIVQILDEHDSKNKNASQIPTAQQETELVLEPLNKALEKDNQRLKLDNAVLNERLKEREICKQELLNVYQSQIKDLGEENSRLKIDLKDVQNDLKDVQNGDQRIKVENLVLKERGVSQMAEIQSLRNELQLERERREEERKTAHEMLQMAMKMTMDGMDDRKRKRSDEDDNHCDAE